MTPEEQAEFEKTLADLAPEAVVAPEAQALPDAEAVDQIMVDAPDFEFPDQKASPVAEAVKDDALAENRKLEQANPFAAFDAEQRQQAEARPPREENGVKFVDPPQFDMDRHERGRKALPQLEEFMRDMAKQGKLTKDGFLNDDEQPVNIGLADVDEILQENAQNQGGAAILAWVRKQEDWKRQVLRAFTTVSTIDDIQTGLLREITDGMIRRHS